MIGIASPAFCSTPFLHMAERVAERFDLWEILSEGEHRLELLEDGVEYAGTSLGMAFQVHAPMSDVNIGSVHEPMRAAAVNEIRQTIAMCRRLNIDLMTFHPGFVNGIAFLNRQRTLDMTKQSIAELALFAEDHSVTIAVENLPGNINAMCTTASELLSVVEGTDVGICFDMGHANTAGAIDEMIALSRRFCNVHLHNNDGKWDRHNRIDDGTADLEKVLGALLGSYSGNYIIESTDLEQGILSREVLQRFLD